MADDNELKIRGEREVNGYGQAGEKDFSSEFVTLVYRRVGELRPVFRQNRTGCSLDDELHFGYRFDNTERVFAGIACGISRFYADWPNIDKEAMENVERHHLDHWVNRGLRDAAMSDHWYTFEKDWGDR